MNTASAYPIQYSDGQIIMSIADLSSAGFGIPWGHTRAYSNQLTADHDYGNGYNWTVAQWSHLVNLSGDQSTVVAVLGSEESHRFKRVDGEYVGQYGTRHRLHYDASSNVFKLTCPDGSIHEYAPFEGYGDGPSGQLVCITSPGGKSILMGYGFMGRPAQAIRSYSDASGSHGERYLYSYIEDFESGGSDDNGERLEYVTLQRLEAGYWQNINRVKYTYYESTDDHGDTGDLKTVTRQDYVDGQWTDRATHYYRYYVDTDSLGSAHGLKYVLEPAAYASLCDDPGVTDPADATDAKVAQYASNYFEYDAAHRVTKETVHGGEQTFTFAYTLNTAANGFNNWKRKTIEIRPDGSKVTVYTNYANMVLLKQTESASGGDAAVEYWQYDSEGREILHATPDAVDSFVDNAGTNNNGLSVSLETDQGKISLYDYYTTGPVGYRKNHKIKEGTSSTPVLLEAYEYTTRTVGGVTLYDRSKVTMYRDDDGTGAIETTFANQVDATGQIIQRTVTLPAVPASQNGSGSSATRVDRFDTLGNREWSRDERGTITHYQFDAETGALVRTIQDVDDTKLAVPTGWASPSGGGLHLTTDIEVDSRGRVVQTLGPVHDVDGQSVRTASWTVYDDAKSEVRSAQGYTVLSNSTSSSTAGSSSSSGADQCEHTLVNPVAITKYDLDGKTIEQIEATRASTSGKLSPTDTFAQSSYTRWTTQHYNAYGQLVRARTYHAIPATGTGTSGTNYDETTLGYDAMGRQNATTAPGGTVTRTVLDHHGNRLAGYIGTNDTGATDADPTGNSAAGNNMVCVAEYEYDPECGCGGASGRLTKETQHVDALTTRTTEHEYDWRGRRVSTDGELDLFEKRDYDNLGRVTKTERYDTTESGNLLARSETFYDDRGRVFRSKRYAVDPADGTVGDMLVENTWYDAAGQVIKQQAAGSGAFTKTTYDGLGRPTKQYQGFDSDETTYAEAATVAGDTIMEQQETAYDPAGNVLFVSARQRFHDATGTGGLTNPLGDQPKARVTHQASWHDPAGRTVAMADYGTNGGSTFTRPATVPTRSDTVLVTTTEYNDAGAAFKSIDPAGREDRQEFDDAGRVLRTIQNYTDGNPATGDADEDVTVETTYTPDGQTLTLTAKNSTTGDQVTRYVYGTTLLDSAIARADLLRAEIYPDSDDTPSPLGDGTDGVYDRVEFAYNRQGQPTAKKDQNGTVHNYTYDNLGRRTADAITTLGSGVDGSVRRIATTYEVRGMVESLTSYDAPTGGNALNQVAFQYDQHALLVKEHQEHSGLKDANTPYVAYNHDTTSSSGVLTKALRPTSVRYPNGRLVHTTYGTPGSTADTLNRIHAIHDDNAGSPGDTLARYSYLGAGTIVVEDYVEPEVKLDYVGDGSCSGFDRFGRIVDQKWYDYGAAEVRDRYRYGYDRAGNRVYRENTTTTGKDEYYTYDEINRLITFDRGDLNANKTAISGTLLREEDWTLDALGNWSDYVQKTSGTTDLDQARTHNKVNETTAITATTGTNWADPVHDACGNMTTIPKPSDLASSLTAKYDAWNRLVEVADGQTVIGRYEYDAQNRRIKRHIDTDAPSDPNGIDTYIHYFYNSAWQLLETRETANSSDLPDTIGPQYQNLWSPRYIDSAILRDENTDHNSQCNDERLYYLNDANFNITSLVDTNGDAVERYTYSPYGRVTIHDTTWQNTRASSSFSNRILYTGRESDSETTFMYYRTRYYGARIGRFLGRDPVAYISGDVNTYCYVSGSPLRFADPYGLWGTEIHHGLTEELARRAGIGCALGMAEAANRPDTDHRSPTNAAAMAALKRTLLLLAKPLAPERMEKLRKEAAKLLQDLMKWHFPVCPHGFVHPGGPHAAEIAREGIAECNFTKFSEGLHPFQDSWSHAGTPSLGEFGGHGAGVLSIPNLLGRFIGQLRGAPDPSATIDIQLRGLAAAVSTSTDLVQNRPADVRAMSIATFDLMVEFKRKCGGKCLCPHGSPVNPDAPAEDRPAVEAWLTSQYRGDNRIEP